MKQQLRIYGCWFLRKYWTRRMPALFFTAAEENAAYPGVLGTADPRKTCE